MTAAADDRNLLRLLEEQAERLGLELRCEALGVADGEGAARGGLCTLNERRVVFVDPRSPIPERIAVLAAALAALDLDAVFLPPAVRRTVERAARQRRP